MAAREICGNGKRVGLRLTTENVGELFDRGFGGFAACRPEKFVENTPEHQSIGVDADCLKLQNSRGTGGEPVMISTSTPGVT